jgi:hypothetical protein
MGFRGLLEEYIYLLFTFAVSIIQNYIFLREFRECKPSVISKSLRFDTCLPISANSCGGRDPSERKSTVHEICLSGKW